MVDGINKHKNENTYSTSSVAFCNVFYNIDVYIYVHIIFQLDSTHFVLNCIWYGVSCFFIFFQAGGFMCVDVFVRVFGMYSICNSFSMVCMHVFAFFYHRQTLSDK